MSFSFFLLGLRRRRLDVLCSSSSHQIEFVFYSFQSPCAPAAAASTRCMLFRSLGHRQSCSSRGGARARKSSTSISEIKKKQVNSDFTVSSLRCSAVDPSPSSQPRRQRRGRRAPACCRRRRWSRPRRSSTPSTATRRRSCGTWRTREPGTRSMLDLLLRPRPQPLPLLHLGQPLLLPSSSAGSPPPSTGPTSTSSRGPTRGLPAHLRRQGTKGQGWSRRSSGMKQKTPRRRRCCRRETWLSLWSPPRAPWGEAGGAFRWPLPQPYTG